MSTSRIRFVILSFTVLLFADLLMAAEPQRPSTVKPLHRQTRFANKRNKVMNERIKQGNVDLLFIGDSITQGWEGNGKDVWRHYYGDRNAANLGVSGDRLQHVLWRLDHGNLDGISPKLAVLMIGTNNSARNTSEEIAAGVEAIVNLLRRKLPETKLLVLGIFPRGETPEYRLRQVNQKANEIVSKLDGGEKVIYMDIGDKFLQPDGTLTHEVMPGLLHPGPVGYQIWAEAIEPTVVRVLGDGPKSPPVPPTDTKNNKNEQTANNTAGLQAPVEIEPIVAPFKMPQLKRPSFPDRSFNIVKYGAVGDGKTKNTEAFKKAIDACSAAGGGKVLVPDGKWFTGAIHLKSNVNLHFEKGAELHFSTDPKDYLPVVFTRWEGFELYNYSPLIYAIDCENIAVTGPGKMFGHGKAWWDWKAPGNRTARGQIYPNQILKGVPPEKRVFGTPEAGLRPQFISPTRCKNVLFEGFTIATPGPFWTFDILYCENIIVRDLHINTVGGPNTDGINISSSRNALIEYCSLKTGDDCITMKSGINEEGWRIGRPTENVVVRYVKSMYSAGGGITIGSEMSGGVRNLLARDCDFQESFSGIRLKSNNGRGGVVENIWCRNLKMSKLRGYAFHLDLHYGTFKAGKRKPTWPLFRNITIENLTCNGATAAVKVVGASEKPIKNITLENISIKADTGMTFAWVDGLSLKNVECRPTQGETLIIEDCKNVVQTAGRPAKEE